MIKIFLITSVLLITFRKGQGLTLTGNYTYDDGMEVVLEDGSHVDFFEREPFVVSFTSRNTGTRADNSV